LLSANPFFIAVTLNFIIKDVTKQAYHPIVKPHQTSLRGHLVSKWRQSFPTPEATQFAEHAATKSNLHSNWIAAAVRKYQTFRSPHRLAMTGFFFGLMT